MQDLAKLGCGIADSLERARLAQLALELVTLDEPGEAAVGAGRQAAHPLAANEDVRPAHRESK